MCTMHFTFRHEEDEVDPYHNQHQHHRNDNGNQQHYYQRQGRQLHPHHMVRQPRSRSAASLPIAGVDVSQPIPPGCVAPNGMPPNAAAAAAMRRESAVSVTSLSVYDPIGGQMTGSLAISFIPNGS